MLIKYRIVRKYINWFILHQFDINRVIISNLTYWYTVLVFFYVMKFWVLSKDNIQKEETMLYKPLLVVLYPLWNHACRVSQISQRKLGSLATRDTITMLCHPWMQSNLHVHTATTQTHWISSHAALALPNMLCQHWNWYQRDTLNRHNLLLHHR